MSLLPECQRQVIGKALIREGLPRLKDIGFGNAASSGIRTTKEHSGSSTFRGLCSTACRRRSFSPCRSTGTLGAGPSLSTMDPGRMASERVQAAARSAPDRGRSNVRFVRVEWQHGGDRTRSRFPNDKGHHVNLLTILDIRARAVIAPLGRPIRTASGSIDAAPLVLLDVVTEEGITGSAYLFAYTPFVLRSLRSLVDQLTPLLRGQPVVPLARQQQLERQFRLLGLQGLLGMVVSTLDMAFWDALGKAADQPVVRLLGGEAQPVRAYDSWGLVDPVRDASALERSVSQGFRGIKIKLGGGDLAQDLATLREVRNIVGYEVALMADYNQSLDPGEAIRRIRALEPFALEWVEEPVAAEDLQGHARVRSQSHVPIQTGENWWFPRDAEQALTANACDRMMPDLMKIGGITGWLSVMGLARAASMPVSSHLFIEASAHALAVTPTCDWLEFMDFGSSVLEAPCVLEQGCVVARGPGLGIAWDERAVARYLVD
jgi:mandelate racemase